MRGKQNTPHLLHGPRRPLQRSAPKLPKSVGEPQYLVYQFSDDHPIQHAFYNADDAIEYAIATLRDQLDVFETASERSITLEKACDGMRVHIEALEEMLKEGLTKEVFKGWVGLSDFEGLFKIDLRVRDGLDPYR
jgi:hypothetical protein